MFKKDSVFESIEFTIGRTGTKMVRVANFLRFFRIGMQNRYPVCCVINFAWDRVTNKPPCAKTRGSVIRSLDSSYVPCKFHTRRHSEWVPYNTHPRKQLRLFSDKIGRS